MCMVVSMLFVSMRGYVIQPLFFILFVCSYTNTAAAAAATTTTTTTTTTTSRCPSPCAGTSSSPLSFICYNKGLLICMLLVNLHDICMLCVCLFVWCSSPCAGTSSSPWRIHIYMYIFVYIIISYFLFCSFLCSLFPPFCVYIYIYMYSHIVSTLYNNMV